MPRRRELAPLALAFLVNGILFHSLLPRFPEIVQRVGASAGQFGLVLTVGGVGGLAGALGAPFLGRRIGVARVTTAAGLLLAAAVAGVALAPDVRWLGAAFAAVGLADGGHDVSMNELAVGSQQRRAGSIMGRLHGIWSLGATAAAAVGAGMVALDVPVTVHVVTVCAVGAALQLRSHVWMAGAGPASTNDVDAGASAGNPRSRPDDPPRSRARQRASAGGLLLVALLAAVLAEQTPLEWAALMLSRVADSSDWLASAAPAVFSAGILLSRGATDRLVDGVGAAAVLRTGNLVAAAALAAGLAGTLLSGSALPLVVALPLAGAGVAANFPLLFDAGDRLATSLELPAGTGTSVVGMLPRLSGLLLPVAIGTASEVAGLGLAIAVAAAGAALAAVVLPSLTAK